MLKKKKKKKITHDNKQESFEILRRAVRKIKTGSESYLQQLITTDMKNLLAYPYVPIAQS